MKKTIAMLISSFALVVSANAAVLQGGSVVTLTGASPDTVILGTNGLGLVSGFYGAGYFNLTDLQVTDYVTAGNFASLNTAFQSLASDNFLLGLPDLLGVGATPGLTAIGNGDFNPTSAIGRTMYTYITDGAALGDTDNYALYKHTGIVFAADPGNPSPPTVYNAVFTGGSLLVGSSQGSKLINVTDIGLVTFNQSFQLVPEPSAAFLGALGALVLLRRRRV